MHACAQPPLQKRLVGTYCYAATDDAAVVAADTMRNSPMRHRIARIVSPFVHFYQPADGCLDAIAWDEAAAPAALTALATAEAEHVAAEARKRAQLMELLRNGSHQLHALINPHMADDVVKLVQLRALPAWVQARVHMEWMTDCAYMAGRLELRPPVVLEDQDPCMPAPAPWALLQYLEYLDEGTAVEDADAADADA